jgi:hypothetical protein
MSKYKTCKRHNLEKLLKTVSIENHLSSHSWRISELLARME